MTALDDYLKGGAPVVDEDEDGIYIGVPAGSELEKRLQQLYRTPSMRRWSPSVAGKAYQGYKEGSEVDPGRWDPNELLALQLRLNMAGLLDEFIPGSFDKATRGAYRDLLSMSNASLKPWDRLLAEITEAGGVVGSGDEAPPLVIELTDATEADAVINVVSRTLYGGRLPDDMKASIVEAFHQIETQRQTAAYQAKYGGAAASTVTGMPSLQGFAEEEIRARAPDQVRAVEFQDAFDQITDVFGGTGR